MPLFAGFGDIYCYDVIMHCTKATSGDVVISLAAFWSACLYARSRLWLLEDNKAALMVFLGVGMFITVVFEALATGPLERWQYAESMPVLPLLGTGLAPVAQWIVLPLLQLWFVRRQLCGGNMKASRG